MRTSLTRPSSGFAASARPSPHHPAPRGGRGARRPSRGDRPARDRSARPRRPSRCGDPRGLAGQRGAPGGRPRARRSSQPRSESAGPACASHRRERGRARDVHRPDRSGPRRVGRRSHHDGQPRVAARGRVGARRERRKRDPLLRDRAARPPLCRDPGPRWKPDRRSGANRATGDDARVLRFATRRVDRARWRSCPDGCTRAGRPAIARSHRPDRRADAKRGDGRRRRRPRASRAAVRTRPVGSVRRSARCPIASRASGTRPSPSATASRSSSTSSATRSSSRIRRHDRACEPRGHRVPRDAARRPPSHGGRPRP